MFKSAVIYRIAPGWDMPATAAFEEALERARFAPCSPSEQKSSGWIEPRGAEQGALVEWVGGQLILSLRTESRTVPGSAVRDALEERLRRIEQDTGHRPGGKQRRELKEEILVDLLPRAFSKYATTRLWFDPAARLLVVGAGNATRADEAVGALVEVCRDLGSVLPVSLVKTAMAPASAMSIWLAEREAPAGFSIDRECELKQAGAGESAAATPGAAPARADDKASVRYARHALDIDEIVAHIAQGKQATRLAMTWQDRVSFVLDSTLSLKRIEILDVALEAAAGGQPADGEDDGFDADVAIATAELGRMLPALFEALGGEVVPEPALAAPASVPAQAQAAGATVAPWEEMPGATSPESGRP